MDAAARADGIDPAELRRRNMIRPAQMPYTNPMGKTYDSGKFESVTGPGAGAGRLGGLRRARHADAKRRGRLRGRGMAAFLEWTGADVFEERVTVTVVGRRLHRDLLGDAGDGAGPRHDLRAARGRRVRRADRKDPHRAGRHRPRHRLRQRRLALAVRRRLGGEGRLRAHGRRRRRNSPREALEAAAERHRVCATACSTIAGTDRRIGLFDLARRQPGRRDRPRFDERGRRTRRGRTPATSARSRSTRTPAPSRSPGTGR